MPSWLRFCVSLLAPAATDANNWTKANVRRGLVGPGTVGAT